MLFSIYTGNAASSHKYIQACLVLCCVWSGHLLFSKEVSDFKSGPHGTRMDIYAMVVPMDTDGTGSLLC